MFMEGSGKPAAGAAGGWLRQRLAMYSVISKPKRQSMNSGLVQFMVVSLIDEWGCDCAARSQGGIRNIHAIHPRRVFRGAGVSKMNSRIARRDSCDRIVQFR
jgi:hypothetical protein